MRKWTREAIVLEIRSKYEIGHDLTYTVISEEDLALLRAACRLFGSWRGAIEAAGLDYDSIRRYRTWNRDRIVKRIQELHSKGEDLSWRHVSMHLDPQLAAAAAKLTHFGSWRSAITAAGLDYAEIRRYKTWDVETIKDKLRELNLQGVNLNAKSMEKYDITLITAARRHFNSWDSALSAAGLDYRAIVLRAPFKRRCSAKRNVSLPKRSAKAPVKELMLT